MERPPEHAVLDDAEEVLVSCSEIDADFNYRRRMNAEKMTSLRADIKARGLMYPVFLRRKPDGRHQLLVGNRRFKAFTAEFGIDAKIRSKIFVLTDEQALAMMMAENGEREDPSAIEEAEGAARMLGHCNGDRHEAAARLGWDRPKLNRRLALMNAIQAVRDAYLDSKIDLGHVEILAALRKEVQERVITVMLAQEKMATVEQLKQMAAQSLQNLDSAIFDKAECTNCQFNTAEQQALFTESFEGRRCTNKECFGKKTEGELEKRRLALVDTYQVVRIVRPGDNATVVPLRADGKRPVGPEQAAACRSCGDFGAFVSALPDAFGTEFKDMCFNVTCNDAKVEAHRAAQKAAEQPPDQGAAGASQAHAGGAQTEPDDDEAQNNPKPTRSTPTRSASANSIRGAIKEYREQVWRVVFERMAVKLPVEKNRALLIAVIAHRATSLDGSKAMGQVNKALGTDVPLVGTKTEKLMRALLKFDKEQLGKAFQVLPAHVRSDMPIEDIVGLLKGLDVQIEQFWKLNETFLDVLTKSEIDAVCQEIGLAKAAGKTYGSLRNGSKKEYVAAMLKVEGFNYTGAVPKMIRW
ncbi:PRTRC system ParB family protein [Caenimonas sedimenti]|uniref:PRTRC system ParB family protein n=2 Tax=Caenimonas sedimenti TaxID=2596921 RepID=A0A562ZTV1_9BURK|nr:PRTRC system ParB family protein [Caenimonas sedimenti]